MGTLLQRKALTIEEVAFVENYLTNFDVVAAADAAGISIDIANKVLENPVVKDIVDKEQGFRFRRLTVSNSRTLLHIAELAYKTPLLADEDSTEAQLRQMQLDELDAKDSMKALELLCKYGDALKMTPAEKKADDDLVNQISTIDAAADIAKRLIGVRK